MQELSKALQEALGKQYTIEREMGGGGMSRVFLARDHQLARQVVVKVLHPHLARDPEVPRHLCLRPSSRHPPL